jgi:hypothetical protein
MVVRTIATVEAGVWLTFFLVLFDLGWYLGVVLAIETRYSATTPWRNAVKAFR